MKAWFVDICTGRIRTIVKYEKERKLTAEEEIIIKKENMRKEQKKEGKMNVKNEKQR